MSAAGMDAPAAFVPQAALERVAGAPLFYPAARDDCRAAVDLLAPYVTEFWFVDTDYFRSREQSAARAAPLLAGRADYRLLGTHIAGPPCADKERRTDPATGKRYDWLAPCVRTEVYDHCATGRAVRIHRRRGYGASALRTEIQTLGVFFYRGDSQLEGGSRTRWLTLHRSFAPLITEVLDRLIDGGLLVTDGSNCCSDAHPCRRLDSNAAICNRRNPYAELARFYDTDDHHGSGAPYLPQARPFTDPTGRRFEPVGYAEKRYGPTLVWQVWKPGDRFRSG